MITLDLRDRRPIYEQIVERFEILILNKVLNENDPMPSVRNLATELAINPNTIQKAYVILENKGYIYTVLGKGSFVSSIDNFAKSKKDDLKKKINDILREAKNFSIEKDEIENILMKIYENT